MPRKEAAVSQFIKDTEVDVYSDGRASGDLPLKTLDPSTFDAGPYSEVTSQNFYDAMFDPDSDKDGTKEHAMIVSPNGEILCVNQGDEHSCGFTQQQIAQHADGAMIIHNHPPVSTKGLAGTFSGVDISGMGAGEKIQVIAAPEGIYTMEFPDGADVSGFKKEIADTQATINSKLVNIRIKCAKEWFEKGKTDAERERTRAEAMRTCIDMQKEAWSNHIAKIAKKHGVEYSVRLDYDAANGKNPNYIPGSNAMRNAMSSHMELMKAQTMRYGYTARGIMESPDGKMYGYYISKGGVSMCVDLDGNGIILTGDKADQFKKKSNLKSWLSILRKPE